MKKNFLMVAAMVTGLMAAGCAAENTAVTETPTGYTTENVMVMSKADEGYLNSIPMNADSNLENGYILDDKYEIGDIVEITYRNDDIFAEKLVISDKDLSKGCESGYVLSDEYICIPE